MKNKPKNKKILITGGTGFIGSHLAKTLSSQNQITTLARQPSPNLPSSIIQIPFDITQKTNYQKLSSQKFDYIIHAAAAVSYRHPQKNQFAKTNIHGNKLLYQFLSKLHQKHPIQKIIHLSSVGVYGPITRIPADETLPPNPQNTYEKTKYKSQQIAQSYCPKLPINILQPTLVYGPGDTSSGMFRLIKITSQGMFFRIGPTPVYMHPLYIDNLIQAILLALTIKSSNQTLIIGDHQYRSLKHISRTIANHTHSFLLPFPVPRPIVTSAVAAFNVLDQIGIKPPLTQETVEFATSHRAYSIQKAKSVLDYQPPYSLNAGIKKTVKWLQNHGHI